MEFDYDLEERYRFQQETYNSYIRFQADLEFLQLLSNPKYLFCNLFFIFNISFSFSPKSLFP